MEKYLVTIEFRYRAIENNEVYLKFKTITIGVYDTFDEACVNGNKQLEYLETKFPLNKYWNRKLRFSENGGCFGSKESLISDSTYLTTPFSFFAEIKTLHLDPIEPTLDKVLNAVTEYKEWKRLNGDD